MKSVSHLQIVTKPNQIICAHQISNVLNASITQTVKLQQPLFVRATHVKVVALMMIVVELITEENVSNFIIKILKVT